MTYFLNLRTHTCGGGVCDPIVEQIPNLVRVTATTPVPAPAYKSDVAALARDSAGKNIVLAAHGFHVNRANGIRSLGNWKGLLRLNATYLFIGILWPGDSSWMGALCYPGEGRHAMDAGNRVAAFVDKSLSAAESISLVSHSLGTRLVLQAASRMRTPVRQVALMAGAINNDCLVNEYKAATKKIKKITILASTGDAVLAMAFPIGNLAEGIVDAGHPYYEAALGHRGPSANTRLPGKFAGPWQIPDNWKYGHHHYLQIKPQPSPPMTIPQEVPPNGTPRPSTTDGWQPSWSAAVVTTRFK